MEHRAKGKHKEIEHIEEVDEGDEMDDDDDESSPVDDLTRRVGFGLGLDVGRVREPSPPPTTLSPGDVQQSQLNGPDVLPVSASGSSEAEAEDRDSASSAASAVSSQLMTPEDAPYAALPPSIHQAHEDMMMTTGRSPHEEGDGEEPAHVAGYSKADKGKGVDRQGGITVG
jgi:hypothetical protein